MAITQVMVGRSVKTDGLAAGYDLADQIREKFGDVSPSALILFCSPSLHYSDLLKVLNEKSRPGTLVGCSSAGEFSGCDEGTASASCMAIISDEILFSAGIGRNLRASLPAAIDQLIPSFVGKSLFDYPYKTALVLTDALAGYADEMINELLIRTAGAYQLFGGGAADDAKFEKTHVFFGNEAVADAIVTLEMVSKKPIGIGVKHGWLVSSKPLRVTEANGANIISLNAMPAVDLYAEHAKATGQKFDPSDPLPFFLHNAIGIDTGDQIKIRVPISISQDGAVTCAAEVPVGSTVYIMSTNTESACNAARYAAQAAMTGLKGSALAGSLVFDCAASRLRMGVDFGESLITIAEELGTNTFAGCNTYGQIARTEDQFSGFHNSTAIVCAFPQ